MKKRFTLSIIVLFCNVLAFGQEVVGVVERSADQKPIPTVHIINLNKVTMSITGTNSLESTYSKSSLLR